MREYSCQFGPQGRLAGVVTEPPAKVARAACILVSAGLVPKFGPFRLYTLLARSLAACGFAVLRFDLGGIGDSRSGEGSLPLRERTSREIGAAVDHLAKLHPEMDIVLCGLCSGAEDSFRYAEKDQRIRGVAMIDPFCYRTSGWGWRHFLFRLRRRMLYLLRIYEPLTYPAATGAVPGTAADSLVKYQHMDREDSGRILRTLLARDVRALFIYTGGMSEHFNHRGQLRKMFMEVDFRDRVALEYLPHMEHTQMLEEDRNLLVATIGGWFEMGWPAKV
jgi:pimeloyl-ACP methyl ester carboxylesterase